MSKISIFVNSYIPKPISKQNANSAGWSDKYAPEKKIVEFAECPFCKAKVKNIKRHLKKVHSSE